MDDEFSKKMRKFAPENLSEEGHYLIIKQETWALFNPTKRNDYGKSISIHG